MRNLIGTMSSKWRGLHWNYEPRSKEGFLNMSEIKAFFSSFLNFSYFRWIEKESCERLRSGSHGYWDLHIKRQERFFPAIIFLFYFLSLFFSSFSSSSSSYSSFPPPPPPSPFPSFYKYAQSYNLWEWCRNTQRVWVVRGSLKIIKLSKFFIFVLAFFSIM